MNKVISFSLWCQNNPLDGYEHQTHNMYCNGAIRNLELKKNFIKTGILDIMLIQLFQ